MSFYIMFIQSELNNCYNAIFYQVYSLTVKFYHVNLHHVILNQVYSLSHTELSKFRN